MVDGTPGIATANGVNVQKLAGRRTIYAKDASERSPACLAVAVQRTTECWCGRMAAKENVTTAHF